MRLAAIIKQKSIAKLYRTEIIWDILECINHIKI